MLASQAFPSADSPAALLIRLELLWGSLRTCSAHLKGDRIGLHCHGNSIPFSPRQGTHRPEPNESLFSATPPAPPLLHSCYSKRTAELLRADQLLIIFFSVSCSWDDYEQVCVVRGQTRRWEESQKSKSNGESKTLSACYEKHKMHF